MIDLTSAFADESTPLLFDRSRTVTDWKCSRAFFYNYKLNGKGIVPDGNPIELYLGTTIHDGLAVVADHHLNNGGKVDIDLIADTAREQVRGALSVDGPEGQAPSEDDANFASEQGALVEGILRGFYKHVWPGLMKAYPKIVAIEKELTYKYDGLTFMARPDIILEDKDGGIWYVEYKSTASKDARWINSWQTAVQLHSTCRAIEQTLGVKPTGVIVQGLYKGYKCLVPETPVLTADLKWKPVGDLIVGEKLAAFEEESGNNRSGGKSLREWREAEVLKTGRANLPCYELLLEDGTKFVCSINHQWLTAYSGQGMGSATWKTTGEIRPGLTRIVKIIEPWKGLGEFDPYDAGYLAAAFDGEGCLASMQFDSLGKEYYSLGLQFSQNNNEMLSHVKSLLDKYSITWSGNDRVKARACQAVQLYGKIKLLSFLGKIRPRRLLPKLNFNQLGMIKDLVRKPVKVISKTFVGNREVVTLATSTETFIANGFASHNSYDRQNSTFCYAFRKEGNPPFSQSQTLYTYKYGYNRVGTWTLDGGTKSWVEGMDEVLLADQFPTSPPIFINDTLVDAFFKQRAFREREIEMALNMMNAEEDEKVRASILDCSFPQSFDNCTPAYGKGCPYRKLCFGECKDPLKEGFVAREPHHQMEVDELSEGA